MYIYDDERRERPWHVYDEGSADTYHAFAICGKVFDLRPVGVTFATHPEGGRKRVCGICLMRLERVEVLDGVRDTTPKLLRELDLIHPDDVDEALDARLAMYDRMDEGLVDLDDTAAKELMHLVDDHIGVIELGEHGLVAVNS